MSFEFIQTNFAAFLRAYSFVEGRLVKFFSTIRKPDNQRFYNTYNMENFSGGEGDIDSLIFSIARKESRNPDGILIKEYYSFEAEEPERQAADAGNMEIKYSEEEVNFFA